MLIQLHWQNRADPKQTDFVAQAGFPNAEAAVRWANEKIDEMKETCPNGWGPMVCTEDSEFFMMAVIRHA